MRTKLPPQVDYVGSGQAKAEHVNCHDARNAEHWVDVVEAASDESSEDCSAQNKHLIWKDRVTHATLCWCGDIDLKDFPAIRDQERNLPRHLAQYTEGDGSGALVESPGSQSPLQDESEHCARLTALDLVVTLVWNADESNLSNGTSSEVRLLVISELQRGTTYTSVRSGPSQDTVELAKRNDSQDLGCTISEDRIKGVRERTHRIAHVTILLPEDTTRF
ncbi:hypothetical protein DOTSEDRAFT_34318 [Dothistroma septosporum NZE10]|uniref:Uncharacterized protein n=1 Tax=Dothistroma septosporum (strain NZE10 / CBS 128990) TaxID=675120 RepID=N1PMW9_DOTSN|nr:hypothetical protein DOTSEDRAFT_34318 [Dothistroma septosporum NZE10]